MLWTPSAIKNSLDCWLDFSDLTTLTLVGSKISVVADKSGRANNWSQGTDANRFTRATGVQNGLAAASVAVNTAMTSTGIAQRNGQDIFIVYQLNTGSTDWRALLERTGPAGSPSIYAGGSGLNYRPLIYWSGNYVVNTSTINGSFQMVRFRINGTIGASQVGVNGETSPAVNTLARSGLGSWTNLCYLPDYKFAGYIGEVLICSTELSTPVRDRVAGYLAHKWGLQGSLPVSHPYKSFAPRIKAAGRRMIVV